jgi:glycosyltransferase involved in cell wall biosynthesis
LVVTAHDVIPCLQAQGRFVGAPLVGGAARLLWRMNGSVLRRADRVHCVSAHTAGDLSVALGVKPARCVVAGLPLRPDLSALGPVVVDPAMRVNGRVLHVGNNSFYKNRTQVLRIFARMDVSVACELLMLGPPPTAALQALVSELGLQSRVRWVIDPQVERLREAYLSAHLMLFPSCYEGFGWPALEAMVHGCPLLASDQGSLPEVVGQGGRCLALDDLDGWAHAGSELLANAAQWQEAQWAGLARSRQLLAHDFGSALTAIYRQACA